MRWGEKETCQFVKLYLGHQLLWDPKLPAYKSKPERHKAYNQIIADFRATTGISLNEPEVKTKVKNLRSTYVQEVAKIRKRSGPDSVFKPSIKWFSAWHKCFSRASVKSRSSDDNTFDNDETGDDSCQKIWVDQDDEVNEHDTSNSDPFVTEQDNFLLVLKPEPDESMIKQETLNSSYKMKKKKFKHSTSTDNSERSYRGSLDPEQIAKEDEFDIYGKYIASQLRKMELQKALRLQLEIQSLVSEARISDMSGP